MPNLLPLSLKAGQSSIAVRFDMEGSKPSMSGMVEGITSSRISSSSIRYQIIWDSLLKTQSVKAKENF